MCSRGKTQLTTNSKLGDYASQGPPDNRHVRGVAASAGARVAACSLLYLSVLIHAYDNRDLYLPSAKLTCISTRAMSPGGGRAYGCASSPSAQAFAET
jgi:hypothetical protein